MTFKTKNGKPFTQEQQIALYQAIYNAQAQVISFKGAPIIQAVAAVIPGGNPGNNFFPLTTEEARRCLSEQQNQDFGVNFTSDEVDTDAIREWLSGPVPSYSRKICGDDEIPDLLFANPHPQATQVPPQSIAQCMDQIIGALRSLDFLDVE